MKALRLAGKRRATRNWAEGMYRRHPLHPRSLAGFSDISFDLQTGWALRARAKYQITRRWSVEPCYIHWNVSASPVNYETATFTVNGITARQQLGFRF